MEVVFERRDAAQPELREFAAGRLRGAMRRFAWFVTRVRIRLRDVDGPRGRVETCCQVSLETAVGRTMVVESVAQDRQAALGAAVERARVALARAVRRLGAIPRSRPSRSRAVPAPSA